MVTISQGIERLLFIYRGRPLNQHQIAKKLKVSTPAVRKALKDTNAVQEQDESKRWNIYMQEDTQTIRKKRVDNLQQLYESNILNTLEKKFPGATIILFGSYSTGEDTINSDIDIAILTKEKHIDLTVFEKKLVRTINISFFEDFQKIHEDLQKSLMNGIVLVGQI